MTGDLSAVIDAIAEDRPALAQDLRAILSDETERGIDSSRCEFLPARNGQLTLRVGSRFVHSRFDPSREAARRAAREVTEHADGHVCVGLGMGYHIEALRRASADQCTTVVAVTFSAHIVSTVLATRSIPWWKEFGPDRIVPAWVGGVLPVLLRELEIYNPRVIALEAFEEVAAEWYSLVIQRLHSMRERASVNRNTLRRFGRLWVRNTIRNTVFGHATGGIDELENRFPRLPAVVCGAGPTLDDILPYIPALAAHNLIIAVDTAIPVLQRLGVTAHFAVVSDPQYWNSRHFDRVAPSPTVLVAEPAVHPRILRLYDGPVSMSASLFPLGSFFDRRFDRNLKLGAGGSVATSAWDLARIVGSRDIAMAGVDLAFPDNQTHCRDSFFENLLRRNADRLHPAEHGMSRYLHGASPRYVPDLKGGDVLSDGRMDVYRSWFAEQNRRFPEVHTSVLSPRGSAIEGISHEDPVSRIQRLTAEAGDGPHPPTVPPIGLQGNAPAAGESATETLVELTAIIRDIETVVHDGTTVCRRLLQSRQDDPSDLDAIDARLTGAVYRDVVGFLANDVLEQEMRYRPATIEESISQSYRIYSALEESCRYHITFLSRLTDAAR